MYDAAVGCLFVFGAFGWIWMRGRFRSRLSPVCVVVDGSEAACSDSSIDSLLKSVAAVLLDASVELLASADCSADGATAFDNGDSRRGDINWFGRRRLNRDEGFDGIDVAGFSSLSDLLSDGSVASDGADVLEGVARDRPRKLKVGRVRNARCVVDTVCADESIAFSSGFFSSDATDGGVDDRRLNRLRAKMCKFFSIYSEPK